MTKEEIIAQVNEVLADEFEVDASEFTPDANIKETLELDSLSLVDLIALIDHTFKVKIAKEDLPKVSTFQALYDYIEAHMA